ncbi:hypothetical protein FAZ69_20120 [Trinickia terrae]|uniref:Awr type III effector family protein n=1 Tax=Trinickia terrae TaxID=2571161 RepID=A0A4U1I1A5_9BURK|nr:hypothetical protein [Trinickia terrae]TKC86931.1 hypothetical protein FAZ69_20120 [Trinickia terrae]
MSTKTTTLITAPTPGPQAHSAADANSAPAAQTHAPAPATQAAPVRQTGVLSGLRSRAAKVGHAIAHPKQATIPLDVTAMSAFRIARRGRTTLPHHVDGDGDVSVPAPTLSGPPDAGTPESLAYTSTAKVMRKPQREMQKAIGGFNKVDAKVALPEDGGATDSLQKLAEKRFPGQDEDAIRVLVVRTAWCTQTGDWQRLPKEVRTAQRELLLDALAEVSSGDPSRAQNVLERMQKGLDFAAGPAPAGALANDETSPAWRAAQHLALTANGYDCARRLAGGSWPQDDSDIHYAPRVWLQAANELVKETGCSADPASVQLMELSLSHTAGISPTLQASHASSITHAASKLLKGGELNDGDKGALLAGRQGFLTDGPGTPFAATKNRMARFLNHTIPRATSDSPTLNAENGEDEVPVASQRKAAAALVRPFGYQKSAVTGMLDGVEGAGLGTWEKDEKKLNEAVRGVFDALGQLPAPASNGPAQRSKLQSNSRAIHQLVHQAELEVLANRSRQPAPAGSKGHPIEYGKKLDDATLDEIARNVASKIDDHIAQQNTQLAAQQPGQTGAAPARSSKFKLFASRETRVQNLMTGFRDKVSVADPNDARALEAARKLVRKHLTNGSDVIDTAKIEVLRKRCENELPNMTDDSVRKKATKNIDAIDRIMLGKKITPRGTTTADFREAGERIIDAIEGSGKATITDGGQLGVSTRGITATAASFPLIAPRLNLQASHGRQSVFEFNRSTPAYKISFGTQQRTRLDAGVGVQLGHNLGIARVGGNIEGGYEWDDTQQCTVDLSIARRLKDDDDAYNETEGRRQLKEVNTYLFDNAGKGKSEKTLWNELGAKFYDRDDFSVAWNNQVGELRRVQATADFRAGAKVGAGKYTARINGIAGGAYQYVPRATLDVVDASGQTKIESHRFGSGHRAGVQIGVTATVSDSLKKHGEVHKTDIATVSMLTPSLFGIQAQLHDSFHQAKVTLVRERGKINLRASNADTEIANFSQYKQALRTDPAWMLAFGLKDKPMPTTQAGYDEALKKGSDKIEEYLSGLSENQTQNLKFVLRRRIREAAAQKADALDDRITALEARNHADDAGDIQNLVKQRDALLKRSDSWLPTELLTIQTNDQQISTGLRMGIQVAVQKGARGEREVAALKVKPKQADKLDKVWPMQSDQAGSAQAGQAGA